MVGENTVEMKKLEEITLEDIQNYLYDNDCDETITTKIVTKMMWKHCRFWNLMDIMTMIF